MPGVRPGGPTWIWLKPRSFKKRTKVCPPFDRILPVPVFSSRIAGKLGSKIMTPRFFLPRTFRAASTVSRYRGHSSEVSLRPKAGLDAAGLDVDEIAV